ncbi:uncharacterized protein METZ01_LOCUS120530 [marine metagenome]|uniref:DUF4407 domain-containing protein n=2 Tax=marine metagenome TaxID=408172 RepID=A0A381XS90_9ZZZZ
MFLAILTFLSALTISAVAIYYSVAGLAAIFAAAVIPIIIMGVSLEVGKLVTAVWLHRNWNRAVWWLKTYLAVAVVVLMFITSMGIFGYLSKAHIEQTSMSIEQVAQIDSLEEKMIRSTAKVDRWTAEIDRLLKGDNVRVDTLIEKEQEALTKVYAHINKEKKLANDQANSDIKLLTNDKTDAQEQADREIKLQNDRLDQARERKEADIASAQKKFEESFGGTAKFEKAVETATANELSVASAAQREIKSINKRLNTKLDSIDEKINVIRLALVDKLAKIDTTYGSSVTDIENRISNLRGQANVKTEDIDKRLAELEGFIDKETVIVDTIREEKAVFEKTFRQLEADVGPIKYIAEFVYGQEADANLLERAVRWVIIVIIFVFDPLAVLLLIASQYSFMYRREPSWGGVVGGYIPPSEGNDPKDDPDDDPEPPAPVQPEDGFDEDEIKYDMTPMTEEEEYRNAGITKEEAERKPEVETVYKDAPVQMELDLQEAKEVFEPDPRQTEFDFDAEPFVPKLSEEEIEQLDESDEEWKKAKAQWKGDNPKELIKTQKVAYAVGKISEFPWERDYQDMKVKKTKTESEKMQDELEPINELDEATEEVDNVDKWNDFIDSANEAAEQEDQKKKFESTNYYTKVSNKQLLNKTHEAEDETTTQK